MIRHHDRDVPPPIPVAAHPRDAFLAAEQRLGRSRAERADRLGTNRGELAGQEFAAGLHLGGLWCAILRRPALHDVADIDVLALQRNPLAARRILDHLCEELSGAAHERDALRVFIRARPFADKHQSRLRVTDPEHNLVTALAQTAAFALAEVRTDLFQRCKLVPLERSIVNFILLLMNGFFGYVGIMIGVREGERFNPNNIKKLFRGGTDENIKIMDTSVIIDGRVADVCETEFLDGTIVIPQFILHELQHIADSSDSLKRARGRRGLDILHRIQKMSHMEVRISEEDFPKIRDVDSKLIALAKKTGAKVITNDFNLNKVAELQGVKVLNINDLSNAVKPVALPGESMRVFVLKEGKEPGQGVAYLDDGTMIVVENGRRFISKNVDVSSRACSRPLPAG